MPKQKIVRWAAFNGELPFYLEVEDKRSNYLNSLASDGYELHRVTIEWKVKDGKSKADRARSEKRKTAAKRRREAQIY